MHIAFRHRLAWRQASNTIVVALAIGIVLTVFQIGYDLFKENKQVDSTILQIISMFRVSATQAVYHIDRITAESIVSGLFEYQPICKAQIIDDMDSVLASKERPMSSSLLNRVFGMFMDQEKEYSVFLVLNDGQNHLGHIKVSVDRFLVTKNFFSRAGFIVVGDIVRNIVLSLVLTLIFYRSLIKPLLLIVHQVSSVDTTNPAKKSIDRPKGNDKNEMGLLVATINYLLLGFQESLNRRQAAENELRQHRDQLEELVVERTNELRQAKDKVEQSKNQILSSIEYAKRIQSSLLPTIDKFKAYIPHSFVIWMPKDIVGGDIYHLYPFEDGSFLLVVIDCTGHGVPGALMTMIAFTSLKRIINDENCKNPAEILKRLNFFVQTSLGLDNGKAYADNGLDASICLINPSDKTLTFAGARQPLLLIKDEAITLIKGDKQSIGYKNSDLNFNFKNHTVTLTQNISAYLYTDGFADQRGGKKGFPFSNSRLQELLKNNSSEPFDVQRKKLMESFDNYKGNNNRQDDITILGFNLHYDDTHAYDY